MTPRARYLKRLCHRVVNQHGVHPGSLCTSASSGPTMDFQISAIIVGYKH